MGSFIVGGGDRNARSGMEATVFQSEEGILAQHPTLGVGGNIFKARYGSGTHIAWASLGIGTPF